MDNIVSILCEGPHDVAFVTKILKANGFKNNEKLKLGEYPKPISNLLISEAKKSKVEELNIQELRQTLIPSSTLQKDNHHLFLYAVGGDSKKEPRKNFLKELLSFLPQDEGEIELFPNIKLNLLYFFDADDKGISARLDSLNSEVSEIFGKKIFEENGDVKFVGKLYLGCYIFSEQDSDKGKLENIILPLMKIDNEDIFANAEKYLETHFVDSRCKSKYDHSKSTIGLCGQLQKSGSSNVVCISQSDYLDSEKLTTDKNCIEIFEFIEKFLV